MAEPWTTTVTAFALTRRGSSWLMIRHERLGVTSWELPGGHVDAGETLEKAAARETVEETGVAVDVGRLVACCTHEWHERQQRKIICFFDATVAEGSGPASLSPDEPEVLEVAWLDPLDLESVNAFLDPLVAQQRAGWADVPIFFRMTHLRNADGLWAPARVGSGSLNLA